MNKRFNRIQDGINWITGGMLMALCMIVFVQVIMRKCFGHSFSWSEELTRYLFVWIIYLGVNLGIRDDMQFKIDILETFFKEKGKKILFIVQHLISIAACLAGIYGSVFLIHAGLSQKSPTLQVLMGLVYLVFPIGFILDIVELLRKCWAILTGKQLI